MEITGVRITLTHCPGYHSAKLDLVSGQLTVSIGGNQSMWPSPDRIEYGAWSTRDSTHTVRLSYDDGHLQYGFYLESDPLEHSVHIVYGGQHLDWLLPTLGLLHRHCQGEEVEIRYLDCAQDYVCN